MARLEPTQLIQPAGPLTTTLFPGRDGNGLAALVDGWLTVAYERDDVVDQAADVAKQNRMARAYALYLAYTDVYRRMLAEPNQVQVAEKGSSTYTDKQRDAMKAIADGYLQEYLNEVPTAAADTVTPGTATVPVRLAW